MLYHSFYAIPFYGLNLETELYFRIICRFIFCVLRLLDANFIVSEINHINYKKKEKKKNFIALIFMCVIAPYPVEGKHGGGEPTSS